MAWRQTGYKSLPEAMMTQFDDVYTRHQAAMSSSNIVFKIELKIEATACECECDIRF